MFSNQHPFHCSVMENLKERLEFWRTPDEGRGGVKKTGKVEIISEGYGEREHWRRLHRNTVRDDEPDLL